ncbi:MAG: protease modulator HflC [Planctomycetota bacterium]|nr:protease modulator HflC [Planctomycetota bacterium]MCZ6816666.1 protease modulator HflC [Planctomycetota bacterium]
MKGSTILILMFTLILLIVASGAVYIVPEGQQAIVTQFGKLVKDRTKAGLYFKIPLAQDVHMLEKRLLPWDGDPQDMPTKDKRRIGIDVWARWRIVDPRKFFTAVGTENNGQQRLDERVDSAARAVVANYNLIEVVRSTNQKLQYESEELENDWALRREQIFTGREKMEKELKVIASEGLMETFGMELVDVHIKRINYVPSVREKVYERMRSERMRIAKLYESEAKEERNRILGQTRKELDEIEGDMQQRSAEIRGEADAQVIRITAAAFGKSPEFYEFLRRLEAYKNTLTGKTRLVLSTKNAFLQQFHGTTDKSAE